MTGPPGKGLVDTDRGYFTLHIPPSLSTGGNGPLDLSPMPRKTVITGLGAVTGLGVGVSALWDGLCAGRSAIAPITRFDPSGFRWKLGSEVKDFSAKDYVPKSYRKAVKVMVRDTELAVAAAKLAADDAGLVT